MESIPDFILSHTSPQREILDYFHFLLTEHMGLRSKMRYNIPFYDGNKWICYLNPIKKEGVELAFIYGNKLQDENGTLLDKGRKQVRGLDFFSLEAIDESLVMSYLKKAIEIDQGLSESD